MIEQTANNLFMFSPFAAKYAELYQEVLKGIVGHEQLGNRLISLSERAHAFRQYDKLRELALILSNLPAESYRLVGQYYLALGMCRNGTGAIEAARPILESVASNAPAKYRAKALLLLSAINQDTNRHSDAFKFYQEAITVGRLDSASVLALKGIAVMKAREGYHKHALKDLESIYPLARYAAPHIYFDYLNSYAVELCEARRLEEARNVSSLVISSPFTSVYSEWQETYSEVSQKLYRSRSSVTVPTPKPRPKVAKPKPKSNVIEFPKRDIKDIGTDDLIDELRKFDTISLTPLQLLGVLMKVTFKDRITDAEIDRLCNAYYQLIREYYTNG